MANDKLPLPPPDFTSREVQRQQRAQANADSVFLEKFPAEIRNRIYDLMLGDGDVVSIKQFAKEQWVHERYTRNAPRILSPLYFKKLRLNITQTCQQVRKETISIVYRRTTFRAGLLLTKSCHPSEMVCYNSVVEDWLSRLSEQAVLAIVRFRIQREIMEHIYLDCRRIGNFNVHRGEVVMECYLEPGSRCGRDHSKDDHSDEKLRALVKMPEQGETSGEKMERIMSLLNEF